MISFAITGFFGAARAAGAAFMLVFMRAQSLGRTGAAISTCEESSTTSEKKRRLASSSKLVGVLHVLHPDVVPASSEGPPTQSKCERRLDRADAATRLAKEAEAVAETSLADTRGAFDDAVVGVETTIIFRSVCIAG